MIAISACGSDSDGTPVSSGNQWVTYTGNTSMATIDAANVNALTVGTSSNVNHIRDNEENLQELLRVLSNIDPTSSTRCGGSYTEQGNTVTFSDYCEMFGNDKITLDGSMYISQSGQVLIIKMSDLKVTVNDIELTLNASFEMDDNKVSMDFVGIDGKTYRIEDFVVQDTFQGVNIISGRFYHPDHGYVDIYSTDSIVTAMCDTVMRPTSGKVIVTGANGTDASVTYQGCADYTVCTNQDSMCNAYQW